MSTRSDPHGVESGPAPATAPAKGRRSFPRLTGDRIWRELAKASFAVIGHTTPAGEPRSSGVVYVTVGDRLYAAVAADSWKARHIASSGQVAVTVPVRRGGILSLLVPIPPATISFHASATVLAGDDTRARPAMDKLARLLPPEGTPRRIIEIRPAGHFLTYGLGVSLSRMRDTELARARVPVA